MAEDREIVPPEANFGKTDGLSSYLNLEETIKRKTDEDRKNDLRTTRYAMIITLVLFLVAGLFLHIPLLFLPVLVCFLLVIVINAYIEREKKKKTKTWLILVKPFIILLIVTGLLMLLGLWLVLTL